MKYYKSQLVKDREMLISILNEKRVITYVNLWSLKVNRNFFVKYNYLIDGWPVYIYLKFLGHKCEYMPFSLMKDFWLENIKNKKIGIVGHTDPENHKIVDNFRKIYNIDCIAISNGFDPIDKIIEKLKHHDFDFLFICAGQPKSEEIIGNSKFMLNKPTVLCGRFVKQLILEDNVIPKYVQLLGLTPIYRFYKSPWVLLNRTIFSLPYLLNSFHNFKRENVLKKEYIR